MNTTDSGDTEIIKFAELADTISQGLLQCSSMARTFYNLPPTSKKTVEKNNHSLILFQKNRPA